MRSAAAWSRRRNASRVPDAIGAPRIIASRFGAVQQFNEVAERRQRGAVDD